jgi:hypothetical protein
MIIADCNQYNDQFIITGTATFMNPYGQLAGEKYGYIPVNEKLKK